MSRFPLRLAVPRNGRSQRPTRLFGHTLLNASLRHFPSSTIAFAILLEPVLAGLLAWALFGQTVTPGQLLGGLLVLLALALVIGQQTPEEKARVEPVG